MKPILFAANETAFTSNGIGRLSDAISCYVEEKRNGTYELEMEYPVNGIHYEDILEERIILAKHDDTTDKQPFRIYKITKPMDGVITVLAAHISYQLSKVVVKPCEAQNCPAALQVMKDNSVGDNPFTMWTDITGGAAFKVEEPTEFRKLLGGVKGSILDQFGPGEYEWDKWTVKYHSQRGADTDVVIRYGKNLTDIKQTTDTTKIWTGIVPYWKGTVDKQDTLVLTTNVVVYGSTVNDHPYKMVIPLDLSDEFEDAPTPNELLVKANAYISNNLQSGIPTDIDISFVALWQTDEYANVAPLQRLSLCDTITVRHENLGIDATAKIIAVTYNVLTERYDKMTVGEARTSLFEDISKDIKDSQPTNLVRKTDMQKAIEHATDLINGSLGGHLVFITNANGEPEEMLIMDTDNIATAVNVLRINQNGIGFSSHGYQGPFETAWTLDGHFVADFITTGFLSATRIKGGYLSLGGADNGNGVMHVYDASGNLLGVIDNTGFQYTGSKYYPEWNWTEGYDTVPYYRATVKHYKKRTRIEDGSLNFYAALAWNNSAAIANPSFTKYAVLEQIGPYFVALRTVVNNAGIELRSYNGAVMSVGGNYDWNGSETLNNEVSFGSNVRVAAGNKISFGGLYDSGARIYNTTNYSQIRAVEYGDLELLAYGTTSGHAGTCSLRVRPQGIIETSYQITCWTLNISGGLLDVYSIECLNLTVNGSKSRAVDTKDYGDRLLYCYEMPSPMFGDIGESVLDEDGFAYIFVDPIFEETIDTDASYQVFLQKYGKGDLWVSERKAGYFVVEGTPGLEFAWELKAKQFDAANTRMESKEIAIQQKEKSVDYERESEKYLLEAQALDYGVEAAKYIKQLEEERMAA